MLFTKTNYGKIGKELGLGTALSLLFTDIQCGIENTILDMEIAGINASESIKDGFNKTTDIFKKKEKEVKEDVKVVVEEVKEEVVEKVETVKKEIKEEIKETVKVNGCARTLDGKKVEAEVVDKNDPAVISAPPATKRKPVVNVEPQELVSNSCLTEEELRSHIEEAQKALPNINPDKVKLTVLSLMFMGNMVNNETIFKFIDQTHGMADLEFINTIVKFHMDIVFVPNANSYSINEVFDKVSELKDIVSYEANTIVDNDVMGEVFARSRDRLVEFNRKEKVAETGDPDAEPEVPIIFVGNKMDFAKVSGVPKDIERRIKEYIDNLNLGINYQLNKVGDMIDLVINEGNGNYRNYLIDPNTFIGNGYNLLYPMGNEYKIINFKHKDLIVKVITLPGYILTQNEMMRISRDIFQNGFIYHMFDMTKGREFLSKLSGDEFMKLQSVLTQIMQLQDWSVDGKDGKIPLSRMRFKSFRDVTNFTLVSDSKCKSQLPGVTYSIITEGLYVKVKDDTINVIFKDYSTKTKLVK